MVNMLYCNEKRNEHGMLHCITGPAVIYSNGDIEYWINGRFLSKQEFNKLRIKFLIPPEMWEI